MTKNPNELRYKNAPEDEEAALQGRTVPLRGMAVLILLAVLSGPIHDGVKAVCNLFKPHKEPIDVPITPKNNADTTAKAIDFNIAGRNFYFAQGKQR